MAKNAYRKKSFTRSASASISVVAGMVGILLAAWLIYGTVTIDPFIWGRFAEELIIAVCALFALRLICVIPLPKWVSIACLILLPAGIALYGVLIAEGDATVLGRLMSLAAGSAFALLCARELDTKPDSTLLAALLITACLPSLIGSQTTVLTEIMRALTMAGIFMALLAVRQKSPLYLYLAALGFALGGAANLYASFAGAGAGIGAVLLAPKRTRSSWILPVVLMAALPAVAWMITQLIFPVPDSLYLEGTITTPAFAQIMETHVLRALDLGLLLLAIRWLFHREDAALPVLFAVAGGMLMCLVPALNCPNVWMQVLPLSVLAGVGTAKTART